jgi:hypothetical protein
VTLGRHYGEAAASEEECGPCPVFVVYPDFGFNIWEKSRKKKHRRGRRKVPSRTALGTIRCADMATVLPSASNGLSSLSNLAFASGDLGRHSASVSAEVPK